MLNKIGEGYLCFIPHSAYGLVYKAIHKETKQTVAIKQFKESDEDEHVRRE